MRTSLFISLIALLLSACSMTDRKSGNGKVVQENRTVANYNALESSGVFDVVLLNKKGNQLRVETDENLLEYIETKVKNGTLHIGTKNVSINEFEKLTVYVPALSLNKINLSGAGNLETEEKLALNNLDLTISGAGDADLDLELNSLNAELSGASDAKLAGSANQFNLQLSGAGDVKAFDFMVNNANVEISGAGNAKLYVDNEIDVQVSGAGDLDLKGNAKIGKLDVSGAGDVNKM